MFDLHEAGKSIIQVSVPRMSHMLAETLHVKEGTAIVASITHDRMIINYLRLTLILASHLIFLVNDFSIKT